MNNIFTIKRYVEQSVHSPYLLYYRPIEGCNSRGEVVSRQTSQQLVKYIRVLLQKLKHKKY